MVLYKSMSGKRTPVGMTVETCVLGESYLGLYAILGALHMVSQVALHCYCYYSLDVFLYTDGSVLTAAGRGVNSG